MQEAPAAVAQARSYRWLAAPLLAFALASLTAGLFAKHDPRSKGYFQLFFSDPIHMKAGFASAAAVLACFSSSRLPGSSGSCRGGSPAGSIPCTGGRAGSRSC